MFSKVEVGRLLNPLRESGGLSSAIVMRSTSKTASSDEFYDIQEVSSQLSSKVN